MNKEKERSESKTMKDRFEDEDTFEHDNNTNIAATPESDLNVEGHQLNEKKIIALRTNHTGEDLYCKG